ncbi:MAG TPA: chaperone modulator CbpM [bacterium]|nr:chaperone modulator CbpM [bacterium]
MSERTETDRPKYRISVISARLGIHPQTIRTYEKMELIHPARSQGNTRLFSDRDLRRIEKIQTLTRDLGVNLAGVEVILRKLEQIEKMKEDVHDLIAAVRKQLEEHGLQYACNLENILERYPWLAPDASLQDD